MKAVILSAGEGTRMRPLTITKPKTMLPVAGKPIIQYNIEALRDCGIKDILLIVGYKENMVRNYFKDGSEFGVNISYKTQTDLRGTANAIGYASDFIDDSIIALNGDIILDVSILSEIIGDFKENKPDTLMVLKEVEDPTGFGVVEVKDHNVVHIVEKPEKGKAPSNLINTGIYIFNKDIFEKLLNNVKTEIKGEIENGVTIHGEVYLDEGSIIKAGVYIEGPVYIGKNCDIGPNSYIRGNTYFGDNVHIGNAVEIKNSIIMENTNVSHLSYVGDSVLGSNCNIAAGTNIANLRFDNRTVRTIIKNKKIDSGRRKLGAIVGDYTKTGINSSLSPGVKVGSNSSIGSGVLLTTDVGSNKRVLLKQEHIIQNKGNDD